MLQYLLNLLPNDEGQDLAEYALLVALIALIVVGAVSTLGTNIEAVFNDIASELVSP